jgi:hypothetical protein
MVFFENDHCVKCGHALGFEPGSIDLIALEEADGGRWHGAGKAAGKTYRKCANGTEFKVCNWLIADDDPNQYCLACRLNGIIPALTGAKNMSRWSKLELAKRRCLYTLLKLGLPIQPAEDKKNISLRFKFLEDMEGAPVQTGHESGIITINIAEADDDERERRRVGFHEPYRTLVGHFRHESGHFYWDLLIADSPYLEGFRKLFGLETDDYNAALERHYKDGAPADWADRNVTPYASAHPWEDWAETWAHYLHIADTLESAAAFQLSVKNNLPAKADTVKIKVGEGMDFDHILAEWTPLICALNVINRSMGLSDLYPFVISPPVVEKLRFIHEVIKKSNQLRSQTLPRTQAAPPVTAPKTLASAGAPK